MTAEDALRQAEAEGLTLLLSESSNSGYRGVSFKSNMKTRTKPYHAEVQRGGKHATLGYFATAEEEALAHARSPEGRAAVAAAAAPPAPPLMTAEEALRQVGTEGLTLLRAENSRYSNSTGYKGVSFTNSMKTRPYQAKVKRGGKQVALGYFATAEEAALVFARDSAAHAAPPQPPAAASKYEEAQGQVRGAAARHASGRARQARGAAAADAKRRTRQPGVNYV